VAAEEPMSPPCGRGTRGPAATKAARVKEARARRVAAIMEIGERASKLVPPGTTSDHSDLYDEMGLPR
jgi:hypothetical protein